MGERKDGGTVFPTVGHFGQEGDRGYTGCFSNGMSLRDWFAGQALSGYLSDPDLMLNDDSIPRIASGCYAIADAMIEARDK